ncbi:MAG: metal-sensing transcriptional repressor [Candidatus Magasanikbacteria bacterium]|nr:metal-sensing transcriptional repressor [Candidatus Magasanikbacteria bacterium]
MHTENSKSLKLSRQAAGTLGKVVTMVEKNEYCPDIIQQIDSVMGLLRSCKRDLLLGHLDHCLEHKLKENKAQTIKELMKIYNLSA